MRAGPLRHRCTLAVSQMVRNSSGGATQVWVDVGKVWAEITMPTGRVSAVAEQLQALITAEIRIRPRADVAAGWRLTSQGVTYEVRAPLIDNERTMMRLLCSTVPNP